MAVDKDKCMERLCEMVLELFDDSTISDQEKFATIENMEKVLSSCTWALIMNNTSDQLLKLLSELR